MQLEGVLRVIGSPGDDVAVRVYLVAGHLVLSGLTGVEIGDWQVEQVSAVPTPDGLLLNIEGEQLLLQAERSDELARELSRTRSDAGVVTVTPAQSQPPQPVSQQLASLEKQYLRGDLSTDLYQSRRRQILGGAAPPPRPPPPPPQGTTGADYSSYPPPPLPQARQSRFRWVAWASVGAVGVLVVIGLATASDGETEQPLPNYVQAIADDPDGELSDAQVETFLVAHLRDMHPAWSSVSHEQAVENASLMCGAAAEATSGEDLVLDLLGVVPTELDRVLAGNVLTAVYVIEFCESAHMTVVEAIAVWLVLFPDTYVGGS